MVDLELPDLDRAGLEAALGPWRAEFTAALLVGRYVVIAGRPGVPGCLAIGEADDGDLVAAFVAVHDTIGARYHANGEGVTEWHFHVADDVQARLREAMAGSMVH